MTEAMPFLQKYDITFLRPPTILPVLFLIVICLISAVELCDAGHKFFDFRFRSGAILRIP